MKMKRLLVVSILIVATFVVPGTLPSQQSTIPCCRPVCSGCGTKGDFLCDYQTPQECHNLDGWKVEDCTDCSGL